MAKVIQVEEIEEGMIVLEPVLNHFGQVLIPAGATLKENHKKILKTWNIRAISIKIEEQEEDNSISEELRSIAVGILKERMNWEPRNDYEENLFQIGIIQTAKTVLNKQREE